MSIRWRELILPPTDSVVGIVTDASTSHIALIVMSRGRRQWYAVDVARVDAQPHSLPIEAARGIITRSVGFLALITSEGAVHEWPSGKGLGQNRSLVFDEGAIGSRPLVASGNDALAFVSSVGSDRALLWRPGVSGGAVEGQLAPTAPVSAASSRVGIALSRDASFTLITTAGNACVCHGPDGDTFEVAHEPDGHPVDGIVHPTRACAVVFSRRAEVIDLEKRGITATLEFGAERKLAGTYSHDGGALFIAADSTLHRYDMRDGKQTVLGALPSAQRDDRATLTLAGTEHMVFVNDGRAFVTTSQRSLTLLEHLEADDPLAAVRHGAASAVVEGALGLGAIGERCPACESTKGPLPLSPLRFESLRAQDKGVHRLRSYDGKGSAYEYDDATFTSFHLAELFRGARGGRRLDAWLRELGVLGADDHVVEHYAWPHLRGAETGQSRLARPSLLVATSDALIACIFLPLRTNTASVLPLKRIHACREALAHAAEALAKRPALRIFADVTLCAPNTSGEFVPWNDALDCLARTPAPADRLHGTVARWKAALAGEPLPVPIDAWTTVIEQRSRIWDYGHHVFGYRNQMTVSASQTVVCPCCGYTSGKGDVDKIRRSENASLLDLVAEVAEDATLATRWLDALGVGVGTVERVMCWPRLTPLGTTPDAVFVGTAGVLVLEAKGVTDTLEKQESVARELLERIANAHTLALAKGGACTGRVLVLGRVDEPDVTAKRLADAAWKTFVDAKCAVSKWTKSKNGGHKVLFDKEADVSKRIAHGDEGGIRSMLAVRHFRGVAEALRDAAAECAIQARSSREAFAYDAIRRRAAGFMAFRGL